MRLNVPDIVRKTQKIINVENGLIRRKKLMLSRPFSKKIFTLLTIYELQPTSFMGNILELSEFTNQVGFIEKSFFLATKKKK